MRKAMKLPTLARVAPLETVAPPLSSAWWVARLATKAGFEIRSAG